MVYDNGFMVTLFYMYIFDALNLGSKPQSHKVFGPVGEILDPNYKLVQSHFSLFVKH